MIRALAIATLLVAACQPWYRDAERAGQRATDQKRANKTLAEAAIARDKGDHARAASLFRRAILDVPTLDAEVYLSLARESFAAGDIAGGRAACKRGTDRWPSDSRFHALLVEQKLADGLTALAIDEAGYNSFDGVVLDASFTPDVDALHRALTADHGDTVAGELALWIAHYGVPDHALLVAARESAATRVANLAQTTPSLAPLATAADRADAELAAGHIPRALALYGEVYRLLPASVLDAHFASFAKAAQHATDPESIDAGAFMLAVQGNKDAEAGHLGLAIRTYRKVVARAPWWADAHRNLAALYDAAGMTEMASAERAFADRLGK